MAATDNDTMREIARALRRHIDRETLQLIIDDLLDVPGNKSFRDRIETLAHELLKTQTKTEPSLSALTSMSGDIR